MTSPQGRPWAVSDDFWACIEPLIPARPTEIAKERKRRPGAGRPAKPARDVFEAAMYVLRTGCPWKALPKERFGSASAVHKRFLEWEKAGLFEELWKAGLAEHDQMEGIAWQWQRADSAILKASLAKDTAEHSPTDRQKKGEQVLSGGSRAWRPVLARRDRGPT